MTLFHHDDAYELLPDGTIIRYRHGRASCGEEIGEEDCPPEIAAAFEEACAAAPACPERREDSEDDAP